MAGMTKLQALERAREAKAANRDNPSKPAIELRDSFLDDWYWMELAKKAGYQLPHWGTVATKGKLTTWIHRLGISYKEYEKDQGKLEDQIALSPDWPLRAMVGLMLEWKEGLNEN